MRTSSPDRAAVVRTQSAAQHRRWRHARFERLVAHRRRHLFRYACRLSGNRDTAEDLVQETLLRAWRSIDKLQQPDAVWGWLLTILRHEHARHLRDPWGHIVRTPVERLPCTRPTVDRLADAHLLRELVNTLPIDLRAPLLMQVGGYSLREIATCLGISAAGVGTRLFRSRKALRARLESRGG